MHITAEVIGPRGRRCGEGVGNFRSTDDPLPNENTLLSSRGLVKGDIVGDSIVLVVKVDGHLCSCWYGDGFGVEGKTLRHYINRYLLSRWSSCGYGRYHG